MGRGRLATAPIFHLRPTPASERKRSTILAIRFRCLYDGTDFYGFQRQEGRPTIQGVLESTLSRHLGHGAIVGAGRTDRGVHAQGQVIVWKGPCAIPLDKVAWVLNQKLPESIRLRDPRVVADDWDPIRSPNWKRYRYRIWREPAVCLPWVRYTTPVPRPLDWDVLCQDASRFLGQHDFRAFRGEGSTAKTTVRTVSVSRWLQEAGGRIWCYEVEADGFLYHMVRMMVAAMLQDAMESGCRRVEDGLLDPTGGKVAAPAAAKGLTLESVHYVGEAENGETPGVSGDHGGSRPQSRCGTALTRRSP